MTLEITDPKATLAELRQRLSDARGFLDLDTKEKELTDLRERASAPDLWDDPDEARTVSQRLARYEGLFDMVGGLSSQLDDAEVLLELADEAGDEDSRREALDELAEFLPALKRVLIDERDRYLAQRIRQTPGRRTLAVVGAGHVAGVLAALREPGPVDLAALDRIPPVSRLTRWLGWGIPASIVAALVAVGITQGAEAAAKDLAFWVLVTGIPCTLGAIAAFAHPITIVAAFFTAPVTTLSPVIGAGHVLALVQAWVQPPVVAEFEKLAEDFTRPLRWWRNRLLRVLLVFILTTLGTMLGMYVGGWEIVSKLLGAPRE